MVSKASPYLAHGNNREERIVVPETLDDIKPIKRKHRCFPKIPIKTLVSNGVQKKKNVHSNRPSSISSKTGSPTSREQTTNTETVPVITIADLDSSIPPASEVSYLRTSDHPDHHSDHPDETSCLQEKLIKSTNSEQEHLRPLSSHNDHMDRYHKSLMEIRGNRDPIVDRHAMSEMTIAYRKRRDNDKHLINATRGKLTSLHNNRRIQQDNRKIDRLIVNHRREQTTLNENFDSAIVDMTMYRDLIGSHGIYEGCCNADEAVKYAEDKAKIQLIQDKMVKLSAAHSKAAEERQIDIILRLQMSESDDNDGEGKLLTSYQMQFKKDSKVKKTELRDFKTSISKKADVNYAKVMKRREDRLNLYRDKKDIAIYKIPEKTFTLVTDKYKKK